MNDYVPERDDYLDWKVDWDNRFSLRDRPDYISESEIYWYPRKGDKPDLIHKNGSRRWNLYNRSYDRPAYIDQDGFKYWYRNEIQYYPEDSIIKSMKFDPKEKLIRKYIWHTPPNILTPKIQQTIFELFPHLIAEISFDFLIPEYQELVDYYDECPF